MAASIEFSNLQGWVGFVIFSMIKIFKDDLKTWFADFEKERKQRENSLLVEMDFCLLQ